MKFYVGIISLVLSFSALGATVDLNCLAEGDSKNWFEKITVSGKNPGSGTMTVYLHEDVREEFPVVIEGSAASENGLKTSVTTDQWPLVLTYWKSKKLGILIKADEADRKFPFSCELKGK